MKHCNCKCLIQKKLVYLTWSQIITRKMNESIWLHQRKYIKMQILVPLLYDGIK